MLFVPQRAVTRGKYIIKFMRTFNKILNLGDELYPLAPSGLRFNYSAGKDFFLAFQ